MSKFLPLLLFLSSALFLLYLSQPISAQGRPPPAKSGRTATRGKVTTADDETSDDDQTAGSSSSRGNDDGDGGKDAESDAGSGESEEPGLSKKLLNVLINHLSSHLPKVSTESVVNWVQETFGLDKQTSRNYVRKAQEIKRKKGEN